MADEAEEAPPAAPSATYATAALPGAYTKEEPQGGTVGAFASLLDTVQTALKRQREAETEGQTGDEKRIKTEHVPEQVVEPEQDAEPAIFNIGAMLQNALSSFDIVEPPAANEGADGSHPASVTPAITGVVSDSLHKSQRKMPFFQNTTFWVRSMGLPMLGVMAVSVLYALSQRSRDEAVAAMSDLKSTTARDYKQWKETFVSIRRVFSDDSVILDPDDLDINELGDQETIQMANMATICLSLLESDDIPLIDVHNGFLAAFLPESGILPESLLDLYLRLKTQLCVAELIEQPEEDIRRKYLDRIFPDDLEEQIKQHHPDTALLVEEIRFMEYAKVRKESLLDDLRTDETRIQLSERYQFNAFRDDFNRHLQANVDVLFQYAESHGIVFPEEDGSLGELLVAEASGIGSGAQGVGLLATTPSSGAAPGEMSGLPQPSPLSEEAPEGLGLGKLIQESVQKANAARETSLASLIAEKLVQNGGSHYATQYPATTAALASFQTQYASHLNQYPQQSSSFHNYQTAQPAPRPSASDALGTEIPPQQSAATVELYQKARQAAAAKSSAHARREGMHSTRRPWSNEEEEALMMGLDKVKGPHWSQILSLFGPMGTISTILRDRNQVQLKDKARNLKLFFLKSNSELPYYLRTVTGELKTRAPSTAARKEREERARMNSEEDKAHAEGINILGRGLQNSGPPGISSPVGNTTAMANSSPRPQTGHPLPMPAPNFPPKVATAAGIRAALPLPRLPQPGSAAAAAAANKLPSVAVGAQGSTAVHPEHGPTPARLHAPPVQQAATRPAQNGAAGQNGVPPPAASVPPLSVAVPAQAAAPSVAPVAAVASNGQEPSAEATLLQSLQAATAAI